MKRAILVWIALWATPSSTTAGVIFHDDFNTFDTAVWGDAFNVPLASGRPQQIAAGTDSSTGTTRTGLFMNSFLTDRQVRGIGATQALPTTNPLVFEVGFAPQTGGIDGVLQLWLTTPTSGKNFVINLFGDDFGVNRYASADHSVPIDQVMGVTPNYRESAAGIWNYNTYYRYRIGVGSHVTHVELQDDAQQILWSGDYLIGLSNYFGAAGMRMNLTQYMFMPGKLSEGRAIVDYVRVTQLPVLGDFSQDDLLTADDIPAMLAALLDLEQFQTDNNLSDDELLALGDFNLSGSVTNTDIQGLLNLLAAGGGAEAVPEPSAIMLMSCAALGLLVFLPGSTWRARRKWQICQRADDRSSG